MKNHWLQLAKQRNPHFWTVEFSRHGIFMLKPRRITLRNDERDSLGSLAFSNFEIVVIFENPAANDQELHNFFSHVNYHGMVDILSRLRSYQSLQEKEVYEFNDLGFKNWNTNLIDLEISFSYRQMVITKLP